MHCEVLYYSVVQSRVGPFIRGFTSSLCAAKRLLPGSRIIPDDLQIIFSGRWVSFLVWLSKLDEKQSEVEKIDSVHSSEWIAICDDFGNISAVRCEFWLIRCRMWGTCDIDIIELVNLNDNVQIAKGIDDGMTRCRVMRPQTDVADYISSNSINWNHQMRKKIGTTKTTIIC